MGVTEALLGASVLTSAVGTYMGAQQASDASAAQAKSAQQTQEAISKANSQPVVTEGTVSDTAISRQKKLEALRAGMLSTIKTSSQGVRNSATTVTSSVMPNLKTKLGQ